MRTSSPAASLGRSTPPVQRASPARRVDHGSESVGSSVMGASLLATLSGMAAIALLLLAPRTISVPLGMVLATYLLASLAHTAYERRGPFGGPRRPTDAEPASGVDDTAAG